MKRLICYFIIVLTIHSASFGQEEDGKILGGYDNWPNEVTEKFVATVNCGSEITREVNYRIILRPYEGATEHDDMWYNVYLRVDMCPDLLFTKKLRIRFKLAMDLRLTFDIWKEDYISWENGLDNIGKELLLGHTGKGFYKLETALICDDSPTEEKKMALKANNKQSIDNSSNSYSPAGKFIYTTKNIKGNSALEGDQESIITKEASNEIAKHINNNSVIGYTWDYESNHVTNHNGKDINTTLKFHYEIINTYESKEINGELYNNVIEVKSNMESLSESPIEQFNYETNKPYMTTHSHSIIHYGTEYYAKGVGQIYSISDFSTSIKIGDEDLNVISEGKAESVLKSYILD